MSPVKKIDEGPEGVGTFQFNPICHKRALQRNLKNGQNVLTGTTFFSKKIPQTRPCEKIIILTLLWHNEININNNISLFFSLNFNFSCRKQQGKFDSCMEEKLDFGRPEVGKISQVGKLGYGQYPQIGQQCRIKEQGSYCFTMKIKCQTNNCLALIWGDGYVNVFVYSSCFTDCYAPPSKDRKNTNWYY